METPTNQKVRLKANLKYNVIGVINLVTLPSIVQNEKLNKPRLI